MNRVISIEKENDTYEFKYDNLGNLAKEISLDNVKHYYYDFANRLSKYIDSDFITEYEYGKLNQVTNKHQTLDGITHEYIYTYNLDGSITNISNADTSITYTYDTLGRIESTNLNDYITNYKYITNGNRTSTLISSIEDNQGITYYKYDRLGNIIKILKDDEVIHEYFYDSHNQLIEENDYTNEINVVYTYDNLGNILNITKYELGTSIIIDEKVYEYENSNWEDQLTSFNNESIVYDEIGNPLFMGSKTLEWMNGRELEAISDTNLNVEYKYNKDGIRTSKTVNDIETKYYLEGNKIIFETINNDMLYYMYDSSGSIVGFKYEGNDYYYKKNLQNDVIGILDDNLDLIVTYEYDSYGSITRVIDNTTNNIGTINPYRYRSYYYDQETNLYYLNSRYYSPEMGRFLNADVVINQVGSLYNSNVYAYTDNNPVNRTDSSGQVWYQVVMLAAAWGIALGAIGLGAQVASNLLYNRTWSDGIAGAFAGGATVGVLIAVNPGVGLVMSSYTSSFVESTVNQWVYDKKVDMGITMFETGWNGTTGLLAGKVADTYVKVNPGWIKPQKAVTVLTGNHTKAVTKNALIGSWSVIIPTPSYYMGPQKLQTQPSLMDQKLAFTIPSVGGSYVMKFGKLTFVPGY